MDENMIDYFVVHNIKNNGDKTKSDFYRCSFTSEEITKSNYIKFFNADKRQSFCFIVNSLARNEYKKMGHWVSIHLNYTPENNFLDLKFIDSFAQPYRSYKNGINEYIDTIRKTCFEKKYLF